MGEGHMSGRPKEEALNGTYKNPPIKKSNDNPCLLSSQSAKRPTGLVLLVYPPILVKLLFSGENVVVTLRSDADVETEFVAFDQPRVGPRTGTNRRRPG
jgi:hypothetical protein